MRITDKIDELELQVEPLRAQSEKARKFLVLRDELRGLEISLWLEQLEKIRAGAIKTLSDYENAVRQKEEAQGAVEALYAAAEEHAAQMRDKDVEAEGVRFQMMQRQADANGLENAVAVLRANIQNNLENRDRIRRELEQQEGRADSIGAQIAERKERLEALVGELDTLAAELSAKQGEAEEAVRSAGTLAGELEELRRKEAVENASASEARVLLSALAAAAQELLDRDEAVHQELSAGEERVRQLQEGRDAAQKELAQAREDRDSLQNVLNGYGLRLESRRKKAKEAEERHVKLQMEENALQSRIHMLSEMEKLYEGYSKAVKLVMGEAQRGQLKGVHGPVAGLLHVPDHCTVAIETALGGAMQHIVVEREEDGKAAIQYLKRRDGGRCTFLPLNTIRPSDFREQGVRAGAGLRGPGGRAGAVRPPLSEDFFQSAGAHRDGRGYGRGHRHGPQIRPPLQNRHPGRPGAQPRRLHDRRLGVPQRGHPQPGQRAGAAATGSAPVWRSSGRRRPGPGGGQAGGHRRRTTRWRPPRPSSASTRTPSSSWRSGWPISTPSWPSLPAAGTSSAGSWSRLRPAPPRPRRTPPPPGRASRPWRALPPPCGPRPRARPRARASSRRAPRGIREAIAELNMRRAGLEAEQQAAGQSLTRAGGPAAGSHRRPGRAGADARRV